VSARCGVPTATIGWLARELTSANSAAIYGRLGTTLNRFGTLTSWATMLLNVLTGHLDRPGGMMFAESAAGSPTTRRHAPPKPPRLGRYHSRVRHAPEVFGEFPAACLAEEIASPGPERLRGLLVVAGNPARSIPNSPAVEAALQQLDALICLDAYVNETARFAHVVLPAAPPLTRSHFDMMLTNYTVRNVANFSPPVRPLRETDMPEWKVLLRLARTISPDIGPSESEIDAGMRRRLIMAVSSDLQIPVEEIEGRLWAADGPEGLLELRIRSGPFGDQFGRRPGLTLEGLARNRHTTDLGPLRSRLDEVIRTPSAVIELAPPMIVEQVSRALSSLFESEPPMVLIGRRTLRSKNSWLHNIRTLVSGTERCTLKLHPESARSAGLHQDDRATVQSRVGSVEANVDLDTSMALGVCSLPHGWGHDTADHRRLVAAAHPGVNSNALADDTELDPLAGTPVLNGIPVTVEKVIT
jgi:anaerobic selenocysteine-containing dehydrogenase